MEIAPSDPRISAAIDFIRARVPAFQARHALILGSGLGGIARQLQDATTIAYRDIPGFPISTVAGHAGQFVLGRWQHCPLLVMQGRFHAYEGYCPSDLALPIRLMRRLGIETLVLTNAAGGISRQLHPGALMMIRDHINLSGRNPLQGPNDPEFGPRFFDMSAAYDPDLQQSLREAARQSDVKLHEGVYLYVLGPNFETPAEIRAFQTLGADAVGMSTVPECLLARHCGMRVLGLSVITNLAAGIASHALSHDETLAEAAGAYGNVERLLAQFFARIAA